MPSKGRPRLSPEDYESRLHAYCGRYRVTASPGALPPFPAGQRETPQHREWMSLYKLHNRLGRRGRGQCERCSAAASEGSVFCEAHRAHGPAGDGADGASLEDRQGLLAAQDGNCPICGEKVDLSGTVVHRAGRIRGVLHQPCNQLVGLAEAMGPGVLDRLRAYLWPPKGKSSR